MKIFRVDLEKFRSFRKKQTFNIPAPGLYYLSGVNKLLPKMGANAIGKSTLFEAPYWCLFGKTSLNLKAGQVANWKTPKGCTVTLHGEALGIKHVVCRQWGPNRLTLDGKEVDQDTLEMKLGVSPETFLYSQMFAQFTSSFLDLKPESKLSLLVDLLKLHLWEEASETAYSMTSEIESEHNNLEGQLSAVEASLADIDTTDLKAKAAAWADNITKQIADNEKAKVSATFKLMIATKLLAKVPDYGKDRDTWISRRGECDAKLAVANADLGKVRRKIDNIKREPSVCPACGGKLTKKHSDQELVTLEAEKQKIIKTKNDLTENRASIVESLAAIESESGKRKEITKQISDYEYEIKACNKFALQVVFQKNPYTDQLNAALKKKMQTRWNIVKLKMKLTAAAKNMVDTEFWIKGFKEVRLLVVQDVLMQLELEVNQVIHALGLIGWEIKFDIEKENKTGGVKRGFTTMVLSPDNEEAVAWEAWSGGERQRLKLAGSMGFANLIHSVSGQTPNVEFWDEPTTWTSPEGINEMLESLRLRAERYDRTIIVADHRISNYGSFTGRLSLVKDSSGSHIKDQSCSSDLLTPTTKQTLRFKQT